MDVADIRYLFGYDRWATERILGQLEGIDPEIWAAEGVVGDRGLGSTLVHMLGAHLRWRLAFDGSDARPGPRTNPCSRHPSSWSAGPPSSTRSTCSWMR
jgi:uncharacterized damage-inducible protein DinB